MVLGVPAMIISLSLFGTRSGLNNLDIVDTFINNIGVVSTAVLMAILVALFAPHLKGLRTHLNSVSSVKVPKAWDALVGVIIPAVLIFMLFSAIVGYIQEGYGGYKTSFVLIFGWGSVAFAIIVSAILTLLPWGHHGVDAATVAHLVEEDEEALVNATVSGAETAEVIREGGAS